MVVKVVEKPFMIVVDSVDEVNELMRKKEFEEEYRFSERLSEKMGKFYFLKRSRRG